MKTHFGQAIFWMVLGLGCLVAYIVTTDPQVYVAFWGALIISHIHGTHA